MIFGYTTLFVAFVLSIVAAYYSILGLTAIFASAVIPIIIMGAALEAGKVITAMWLHRNWKRSPWTYKAYLLPRLLVLMLLTSMGIFGFLSKAHLDQTVPTGDVAAQVALIDEKINIERETINNARTLLQQMDRAVSDLANAGDREITLKDGTTRTFSAAERSLQIRRNQANDRAALITTIDRAQKNIVQLQQEKAPIASKLRTIEAEVGPVKYIAALIYGENPDHGTLERAVRWVIILLVIVFDPLAIILILAGTRHIEWAREEKNNGNHTNIVEPGDQPSESPNDTGKDRDIDAEDDKSDFNQRSQGDDLHIRPVWEATYQLREDDRSLGLKDKSEDDIEDANRIIDSIERDVDYDQLAEDLKKDFQETQEVHETPQADDPPPQTHDYLNQHFKNFANLQPIVFRPEEPTVSSVTDDVPETGTPEPEPISNDETIVDDKEYTDHQSSVSLDPPNDSFAEETSTNDEPKEESIDEPKEESIDEPKEESIDEPKEELVKEPKVEPQVPHYIDLGNEYFDIDGKTVHARVLPDLYPEVLNDIKKNPISDRFAPKEDSTDEPLSSKATFGTEFPAQPEKGEMFLNVASLPSRLYKFNGFKWIIVDKSIADSYTYDEDYLQYLVDKIELGHLNPEDLTISEQDQITEYLKKNDK